MSSCVRSGFCCKSAPCPFGKWNDDRTQCDHLVETGRLAVDTPVYACGIFDQVVGQPGAEVCPAFGTGCCSTLFNENRSRIIALTISR